MQLLKRKVDTHKGDYGSVLIIGGSPGLTGAVCLCANAALKAGAGLVTVGVPGSLNNIFEIKLTEVMSLPLEDKEGYLCCGAAEKIKEKLDSFDVIVLGPGSSVNPYAQRLIIKIIKEIDKPIIVDADGITALSLDLDVLDERKAKNLILTPHLGEFSRLVKKDIETIKKKRKELVKEFALRYNLTLVLKGPCTLVHGGRKSFENSTGNPGMATAGMGDVLSGMIAGLAAQGLNIFDSAKFGVYLHGLAADCAVIDKTQTCLIASDIIDYLPNALSAFLKK